MPDRRTSWWRRLPIPQILFALGAAGSTFAWQFRSRFPFDDAFITFRYAEHLARGAGLVWNVGGAHTEGYTNFLYVVLLSPAVWLNLDLLTYSQILNLLALVLSSCLIFRLTSLVFACELRSTSRVFPFLAAALFLATPLIWINALSAMETTLFGFAVLFALAETAKACYTGNAPRHITLAFLGAAMAALVRPEGILLGPILWTVCMMSRPDRERATMKATLFFALPILVYHSWRYLYFGSLLPNSFLIKVVNPNISSSTIFHGRAYVMMFFGSTLALVLASLAAFKIVRSARVLTAAIVWCAAILLFYSLPEAVMGLYDRFLYSVEVVLFPIAIVGIYVLVRNRGLTIKTIVIAVFLIVHAERSWHSPRAREARSSTDETYNRYKEIARILNGIPDHANISFAFADAGIIPYWSGAKHLDLVGLNDNAIAHSNTAEEVLALVAEQKPDMIIIPVDLPRPEDDSCRHIFRAGHGLIGSHYISFIQDARFAAYRPLVLLRAKVYDLIVISNIYSPRAREVEAAFRSRMSQDDSLIAPPPLCLN